MIRVTPAEAVDLLLAPDAAENVSGQTVVVAGESGPGLAHPPDLPCVTVALGPGPMSAACDVAVTDDADVARIDAAVRQRPLASVALVQLLRAGSTPTAESWVYGLLQAGPEFAAWLESTHRPPHRPTDDPVLARVDGPQVTITLNRPHVRNALDTTMRDRLCEVLVTVDPHGATRVVLRGAGPAFCSGGDLSQFGTAPDPASAHLVRSTRNPARLLARLGPRLRAEVHGACVGAGIELAAFAGDLVAAEDADFHLPEVVMGLVPGSGGTVSIPARIGRQRTAWLALTGARIDAPTALRWGLVDQVTAVPLRS